MSKNILLIENALNYQELMIAAFDLNHINHHLHIVSNGKQALNFLYHKHIYQHKPRPNLIILDLHVPKVNGIQLLKIIKKDNNLSLIPVIIFTDSHNSAEIEQCYRQQANAIIAKPIDFEKFLSLVKKVTEFWLDINVSTI